MFPVFTFIYKNNNRAVRFLCEAVLISFGALLTFLALPGPTSWAPLIWVAFIPAFFVLQKKRFLTGFILGCLYGTTLYSLGGFWFWYVSPAALISFSILGGIGYGIGFGIGSWISKHLRDTTYILAFSFLFLIGNWVIRETLLSFPFLYPADAFFESKNLLQAAFLGGASFISLIILLVNGALFLFIKSLNQRILRRDAIRFGIIILLIVFGVWSFGFLRIFLHKSVDSSKVNILVVQNNEPSNSRKHPLELENVLERLAILKEVTTKSNIEEVDFVIWPEAAIPINLFYSRNGELLPININLSLDIKAFSKDINKPLLFGAYVQPFLQDPLSYNSYIEVFPDGSIDWYGKIKPLFMAEHVPRLFKFIRVPFQNTIGDFGWRLPSPLRSLSPVAGIRIISPLCSEIGFSGTIKSLIGLSDATLIINPTNNANFNSLSEIRQETAQARFRAVEFGMPVVSVGTIGPTELVDSLGRKIDGISPFVQEAKIFRISKENVKKTPFVFFGHFVTLIILFLIYLIIKLARLKN